jgi:hypothetical protein
MKMRSAIMGKLITSKMNYNLALMLNLKSLAKETPNNSGCC